MKEIVVLGIIFLASLCLGIIKYQTVLKEGEWKWQRKFAEGWNNFVNFFIAGLVGYYFMLVRWPLLAKGANIETSDFLLFAILTMGVFGHLNVLSYNITKGVEAILDRVLKK
ncbi:MAG: hypothetical protein A3E37_01970 [Candidatus Andersenbacteria bacterium RIFCSPHIGHO2_12_FULL_46_9]|nr:MAG: hypothetical protein A3B76_01475 [Candidatus Andersenbacteria bacterium RIFCSPHIGHO2_02_FULL_46_16]OGY36030.1 MAG: hypothetical protein A3I08_02875 [Candidatus Andersenbacteria bacterium RIFCSPLOWO2_02_FULL_46_11]OGY36800.1 MAG: hypothetical protein A3E37_01970 [Candidatus Andersenbacteria bacterium RIFCSPHIGHO2_12_FULL_46_9]OGY38506.1 MAG: hypothetical protein A3G57_00400 [Candidatus Andersenbacteria bacterium RIFCSPLOWO2_12_FULL_45_8]HBE89979.1 hypothetical protein [Candidatus Anderse